MLCLSINVFAYKYRHVWITFADGTFLSYFAKHSTICTEFPIIADRRGYKYLLSEITFYDPVINICNDTYLDYIGLYQEFWHIDKGEYCDYECHLVPAHYRFNFWIKPEYNDSIKTFEVFTYEQ